MIMADHLKTRKNRYLEGSDSEIMSNCVFLVVSYVMIFLLIPNRKRKEDPDPLEETFSTWQNFSN